MEHKQSINLGQKIEHQNKQYLVPIFKSKKQLDNYMMLHKLNSKIWYLQELDVGTDCIHTLVLLVVYTIMKKLGYIKRFQQIDREKIDSFYLDKLECLIQQPLFILTSEYYREHGDTIFIKRFEEVAIYPKILTNCVEHLEKLKNYKLAVCVLSWLIVHQKEITMRHKWFQRLVLDLKHLKHLDWAYCICHKVITEDNDLYQGTKIALENSQRTLRKSLLKVYKQKWKDLKALSLKRQCKNLSKRLPESEYELMMNKIESKYNSQIHYIEFLGLEDTLDNATPLNLIKDEDHCNTVYLDWTKLTNFEDTNAVCRYHDQKTNEIFSVEDLALHYYKTKQNLNGIHSENGLGSKLFGLFMWDVIFDTTVLGVFQTPYQKGPLDYATKEFYYRREKKI